MYNDTFEEFEGFKRVRNTRHSNAEDIYALLENYKDSIKDMTYNIGMDESDIVINTDGKYHVYITILDNEIVIEAKDDKDLPFAEKEKEEAPAEAKPEEKVEEKVEEKTAESGVNTSKLVEEAKEYQPTSPTQTTYVAQTFNSPTTLNDQAPVANIPTVHINPHDPDFVKICRLIEQIYDLLKDFEKNDVVTEHITSVKQVLTMRQGVQKIVNGIIPSGISFELVDENNRIRYTTTHNFMSKLFCVKDADTDKELFTIFYGNSANFEYSILQPPFENILLKRNKDTVKTLLSGLREGKVVKITGDYTDNHFLLEYDEIVIGAVDCKDPKVEKLYTIEVNNTEFIPLIFALSIVIDLYKDTLTDDV